MYPYRLQACGVFNGWHATCCGTTTPPERCSVREAAKLRGVMLVVVDVVEEAAPVKEAVPFSMP